MGLSEGFSNRHLLLINTPHAQNFGQNFDQIFDQIFGQVFDQGFLAPKYSVQYYWEAEIQCTVPPGENKLLTIYYSKPPKSETLF